MHEAILIVLFATGSICKRFFVILHLQNLYELETEYDAIKVFDIQRTQTIIAILGFQFIKTVEEIQVVS